MKIVLVDPDNVVVPVPAKVKEAKFPLAGIEEGIAVTDNAPVLFVIVRTSVVTGVPAGDQTSEAQAVLVVIVVVLVVARLLFTPIISSKTARTRVRIALALSNFEKRLSDVFVVGVK